MAFTKYERERIKYHLGYLNTYLGSSISLGVPSASQTLFILESSMNDIIPEAESFARRAVSELDCIEDQLSQARDRLPASRTDQTYLRGPEEMDELESQYDLWSKKLADVFGVPINPFSKVHQRVSGQVFLIEPF